MDGLQGPILSGTGFYMKRKALYGNLPLKGEYKYSQLLIKNNKQKLKKKNHWKSFSLAKLRFPLNGVTQMHCQFK